jgi:hypothetical protein
MRPQHLFQINSRKRTVVVGLPVALVIAAIFAPGAQAGLIRPQVVTPQSSKPLIVPQPVTTPPPASPVSPPASPALPTSTPPAAAPGDDGSGAQATPSASDTPVPSSDPDGAKNGMGAREYELIEGALGLLQWNIDGRDGEVARDFLRAYWGPDGDANFGAGRNLPGTVSTPSDDSTDPQDGTVLRSILKTILKTLVVPQPVVAVAGETTDSTDSTSDTSDGTGDGSDSSDSSVGTVGTSDGTTACPKEETPEGKVPLCPS